MSIYRRIPCPKCSQVVAANRLVRHLKAMHPPVPPIDARELDRECRALVEQALDDDARSANRIYWREAINTARRQRGEEE